MRMGCLKRFSVSSITWRHAPQGGIGSSRKSRSLRAAMARVPTARDYSKWLTAEDVVDNVKRYARNGSIITFHDSLKSIDKLKTALPKAIEWLQEQGYEFKIFK